MKHDTIFWKDICKLLAFFIAALIFALIIAEFKLPNPNVTPTTKDSTVK